MSNEERIRVLQMVAEGKVSPAEADDVLASLESAPPPMPFAVPVPPAMPFVPPIPPMPESKRQTADRAPRRILHIRVSEDERSMDMRIPAGLTAAQQEFLTRQVRKSLEKLDINLSEILDDLEQWPSGTTLFNLSEDELSVDMRVETIVGP